jgi:hypothetical protein
LDGIKDQSILYDVVMKNKSEKIRYAALDGIKDQSILYDVVMKNKSEKIRYAALDGIKDPLILHDVVINDKSEMMLGSMFTGIKDQSLLFKIVKGYNSANTGMFALQRIDDQHILIEVAKTDRRIAHRQYAIRKIKDARISQSIAMTEVMQTDSTLDDRCNFTEMITDNDLLCKIIHDCNMDIKIRCIAVANITSVSMLLEIVHSDLHGDMLNIALAKLKPNLSQDKIFQLYCDLNDLNSNKALLSDQLCRYAFSKKNYAMGLEMLLRLVARSTEGIVIHGIWDFSDSFEKWLAETPIRRERLFYCLNWLKIESIPKLLIKDYFNTDAPCGYKYWYQVQSTGVSEFFVNQAIGNIPDCMRFNMLHLLSTVEDYVDSRIPDTQCGGDPQTTYIDYSEVRRYALRMLSDKPFPYDRHAYQALLMED